LKLKREDARTWRESLRVASTKCRAQETHRQSGEHIGEETNDVEADENVLRASPETVDEVHRFLHELWRISQVSSK
jgi:phosphohistidine phosphatase SixA